jgi:hypothetical protein
MTTLNTIANICLAAIPLLAIVYAASQPLTHV